MSAEEFNVWVYLIQVAPVILVMGIAIKALWSKNNELIDTMQRKDEANLITLQQISSILGDVKDDGVQHTQDLKGHIDDRIKHIRELLNK